MLCKNVFQFADNKSKCALFWFSQISIVVSYVRMPMIAFAMAANVFTPKINIIQLKYFSAMSWAIAAGREDLMEKKMSSIVKYFLCSEHFASGCFADPPYNTRLKKTVRPEVSIPIPSIFENNIDKYIPKNVQLDENVNQSQANIDLSFNGNNDLDECYNCEVPSDVNFLDTEMPDINHSGIALNGLINDHSFVNIYPLDPLSDSYDFIIEEESEQQKSDLRINVPGNEFRSEKLTFMCRLCATIFPANCKLSLISNIDGLETKLNSLLPNMVCLQ